MSRITIVGEDKAVTEVLAAGLGTGAAARECRTVTLDELRAGEIEDRGTFVVVPGEVRGFPDVETAARVAAELDGAVHVVLISSAAVNEPNHHHPGMVAEDRLSALRRGNGLAARWRELEERVRQALDGSDAVLTVLRPAALVVPGGRGTWSRYFSGWLACSVAGFDPTIQLLSGADLAAAVARAIAARDQAAGVFNVAPASGIPLRKALAAAGVRRLPLPYWPLRIWYRLLGRPAAFLDYLRYSWTVSGGELRRRLEVRPAAAREEHDDFGWDPEYVRRLSKVFFRFLHDVWWRIEWRGLENLPRQGRAVLAGVHRGHQPWDGVMAMYHMTRKLGRTPRFLVHPALLKFPYLTPYMVKCGGIPACRENAAWVLERDEMLAIFPEGIHGAFRMYRGVYELGSFGRDDFVKLALVHQAPIVPFVTVGSAEIFPIFGRIDWRWWKRWTEWPFLPITPTMGTLPLPSKWHTWVLEPIHVEHRYPPEAARDSQVVRELSAEVRRRMTAATAEMLRLRKSVFYGSIFHESGPSDEGEPAPGDVMIGAESKASKPEASG